MVVVARTLRALSLIYVVMRTDPCAGSRIQPKRRNLLMRAARLVVDSIATRSITIGSFSAIAAKASDVIFSNVASSTARTEALRAAPV